jgi:hypothetical protein
MQPEFDQIGPRDPRNLIPIGTRDLTGTIGKATPVGTSGSISNPPLGGLTPVAGSPGLAQTLGNYGETFGASIGRVLPVRSWAASQNVVQDNQVVTFAQTAQYQDAGANISRSNGQAAATLDMFVTRIQRLFLNLSARSEALR